MQAIRHHPPGGTEKLRIGKEDIPEIDDDEILVKIFAASVIWMGRRTVHTKLLFLERTTLVL